MIRKDVPEVVWQKNGGQEEYYVDESGKRYSQADVDAGRVKLKESLVANQEFELTRQRTRLNESQRFLLDSRRREPTAYLDTTFRDRAVNAFKMLGLSDAEARAAADKEAPVFEQALAEVVKNRMNHKRPVDPMFAALFR